MTVNWMKAQRKAAHTARWAVTMTKVRIRQALARTRWQLVTFCGVSGSGISRGRRPDGDPQGSPQTTPRHEAGDAFQIILIQVKGGQAPMPTAEDGHRLRAVARHHRAKQVLLAAWTKGKAARFFRLRQRQAKALADWIEVEDLNSIFK